MHPGQVFIKAHEERLRQINEEGFTLEHDDQWKSGQLSSAAHCYARIASMAIQNNLTAAYLPAPGQWQWCEKWWKPSHDPKQNIIKAMALLAAEYDRLERLEARGGK
ncbi:hypothetical protein NDQ72_01360 [Halomonas sp. KG2]|uniref:hypothetical protein n=1 Tax=Halomonas sp. KG2 TaxID=2951138 RepID=UPI002649E7AC|nr:hypothetical protein [Halomonas sp. KG2]WKD28622.1 hypothetical protein NDQ72_01360 [Halomonas sp. KG2]